ncbi:ribbon-helix-helix domain-containing protein [Tsuneonella sp. YG55]|uniref:Ribbon-helix-helix domain-containing protein n=1 Tax=Tsuneonella litorea TaxID=2976475 RepID=A0A9X3AA83_9SPHN|nr:ribbon-helix-helix domain-containing protein [Tsuneonella litorea]MCT2559635.1 ribbon-helix-helix domain-containing protein [Tsuneonella litorea]
MTRILADLPDEDLEKLDALAASNRTSRAATIRAAVKLYLSQRGDDRSWIDRGYGLWADRDDLSDSVSYQRAIRDDRAPGEDV